MKISRAGGFSLIELMIAIVIVAILAGVAYPSYRNYVTQARRSDAQSGIQITANRLEKFFGYCNSYPTSATPFTSPWPTSCPPDSTLPFPTAIGLCQPGTVCNDRSPDQHYQLTIALDNSAGSCAGVGGSCNPLPLGMALNDCLARCGYTIVANPNGAAPVTGRQLNDGRFRMDSRGRKEWDKNNSGGYNDPGEDRWK